MRAAIVDLMGIGPLPSSKPACLAWLRRAGVSLIESGNRFEVRLCELPEEVRRAYTVKALEALELDPGTYDEEANAALMAATPGMREAADR